MLGAVASAVLVAAAATLAVVGGGEGGSEESTFPARIAGRDDVEELASTVGHPIYWVGEREGEDLELTAEADGSIYLRYLPEGTAAGDPRQVFLTVGTYPLADALGALRRTAAESGTGLDRLDDGGAVLADPSSPESAYLAYPGRDVQIEVYHPEPGRAVELIRSGAVEPLGE